MSSPYLGEIRTVGFTFAPPDWLTCQGQSLQISDYQALFTLIGTTYGGDGQTTFNLPNLQSRLNVDVGTGSGLSPYALGQAGGTEGIMLTTNQIPIHTHQVTGNLYSSTGAVGKNPVGTTYPGTSTGGSIYGAAGNDALAPGAITATATANTGGQPHANIQPVMGLTTIICVQGVYPPRP